MRESKPNQRTHRSLRDPHTQKPRGIDVGGPHVVTDSAQRRVSTTQTHRPVSAKVRRRRRNLAIVTAVAVGVVLGAKVLPELNDRISGKAEAEAQDRAAESLVAGVIGENAEQYTPEVRDLIEGWARKKIGDQNRTPTPFGEVAEQKARVVKALAAELPRRFPGDDFVIAAGKIDDPKIKQQVLENLAHFMLLEQAVDGTIPQSPMAAVNWIELTFGSEGPGFQERDFDSNVLRGFIWSNAAGRLLEFKSGLPNSHELQATDTDLTR